MDVCAQLRIATNRGALSLPRINGDETIKSGDISGKRGKSTPKET